MLQIVKLYSLTRELILLLRPNLKPNYCVIKHFKEHLNLEDLKQQFPTRLQDTKIYSFTPQAIFKNTKTTTKPLKFLLNHLALI